MTDADLQQKIEKFQDLIIAWAKKRKIWYDAWFKSWLEHFNDEPNEEYACVSVLCCEGTLYRMFNGEADDLLSEFIALVNKTEFHYDLYDSTTVVFFVEDEQLNKQYVEFFEWKWISSLVRPNYTSLYDEVFEYFKHKPEKLYSLSPRQLEILTSEIFRNQGYYTELGPGWKDGGIDLKLYQKDDIDQIVTLVQVKRYNKNLPITLESVAYLQAIVEEEKANRGLFITTSRYLPQAKDFALRQKKRLKLADSKDIQTWCNKAKTVIVRDKSQVLDDDFLLRLIESPPNDDLVGKIVSANNGGGMITSDFCIIIKDSPDVSLLMRVPSKAVKFIDPPHNFRGYEVPVLDRDILKYKNKANVFRAQKSISQLEGDLHFWGQQNLYTLWDGQPSYFDLLD